METDDQGVTVVISQVVKSGCEKAYEDWLKDISSVARTYTGHLGITILRPQPGVRSEYVIIFRFDSYENLKIWMTSPDREYWLIQGKPLLASDPQVQEISGMEAWFSVPGQVLKTPPRYKTALLTWGVVYVLLNLLNTYLRPFFVNISPLITSLIFSGIMVLLMTYVVMPRVSRLFSKWLYAK